MFSRALISVSDKTGLVEFLKPLVDQGLEVISTGGTLQHMRDHQIPAKAVEEITGFPEVLEGRVKTLHPHIHMGLLGKRSKPDHVETLARFGVEFFDLVVVNLYPFREAFAKTQDLNELVEFMDIGGPTMLRAAAKNFAQCTVICQPEDYSWVLAKALAGPSPSRAQESSFSLEDRQKLAAKVFSLTSAYDALIAQSLGAAAGEPVIGMGFELKQTLRYGENPEQNGFWYQRQGAKWGLHQCQILQGKELSYNNLLDVDAATSLVAQFHRPACVAVKHTNPCGVAEADSLESALERAMASDPVSVFGGIVALNGPVTENLASRLTKLFLEVVIAPEFSKEALEILATKKNLRCLAWPELRAFHRGTELRSIAGGVLIQDGLSFSSASSEWEFLGEKPSAEVLRDLEFAEKVVSSLKSNAIALVLKCQTLGLGMGQTNRVDAVKLAVERAVGFHSTLLFGPERRKVVDSAKTPPLVLASDAFFPFPDSISLAAEAGVKWVLQPGGSMRDQEVVEAAKKIGIEMVLTKQRKFKH